jgi:hypothetical protein
LRKYSITTLKEEEILMRWMAQLAEPDQNRPKGLNLVDDDDDDDDDNFCFP